MIRTKVLILFTEISRQSPTVYENILKETINLDNKNGTSVSVLPTASKIVEQIIKKSKPLIILENLSVHFYVDAEKDSVQYSLLSFTERW